MSLPDELLEEILTISVGSGFPDTIAAFSRTSRRFHELIYKTEDTHLWREMFLTIFDDPRPAHALLEATSNLPKTDLSSSYDWRGEFIRRMLTKRYMERYLEAKSSVEGELSPLPITPQRVMETLLSLLAPLGPPFFDTIDASDVPSSDTPSFPPLIVLISTQMPRFAAARYRSKNGDWFESILSHGYPQILTQRLMGAALPPLSSRNRTVKPRRADDVPLGQALELEWEVTEEGRAFYKLVFWKGFIASPIIEHGIERRHSPRRANPAEHPNLSASAQIALARSVARRKVFNMRYLSKDRCWGPFLPLHRPQPVEASYVGPGAFTPMQMQRLMDDAMVDDEQNTDAEEGDSEYMPTPHDSDDEENTSVDLQDAFPSLLFPSRVDDEEPAVALFPEFPHEVKPDYPFLASARMVIEENIRSRIPDDEVASPTLLASPDLDPYGHKSSAGSAADHILAALRSFEGLRFGSAPQFWGRGWHKGDFTADDEDEGEDEGTRSLRGGPERPGTKHECIYTEKDWEEDPNGWDWAGVAGEWRRCVCWMDYRDLLFHNLRPLRESTRNREDRETLRIFPMTLRIVGYEKAPTPPPDYETPNGEGQASADTERMMKSLVYTLPILHLEGEARGSDLSETAGRKVWGTVRMIGDGAVRWSLCSSEVGASEDEWTSESIQVGAIGSATGILGLWTGAGHERSDPLGPTWAWKID